MLKEHAWPSLKATDSCGRWQRDVDLEWKNFPVLELLRQDPKRENLSLGHGLVRRRPIGKNARKLRDLREPAAIFFAFALEIELHVILL